MISVSNVQDPGAPLHRCLLTRRCYWVSVQTVLYLPEHVVSIILSMLSPASHAAPAQIHPQRFRMSSRCSMNSRVRDERF